MKKLVGLVCLCLMPAMLNAQDILKSFEASLLDHVVASTMFGFTDNAKGPSKLVLVDSIVRVGHFENDSLLDLQAGFFGNANDVTGENNVANWIAGAQLRVDPFMRKYLNLNPTYEFLNAVEHGVTAYYDFTNEEFIAGYSVGMSFDLVAK